MIRQRFVKFLKFGTPLQRFLLKLEEIQKERNVLVPQLHLKDKIQSCLFCLQNLVLIKLHEACILKKICRGMERDVDIEVRMWRRSSIGHSGQSVFI